MLQFLQVFVTTAVSFGKNRLYVNINGMRFESCCSLCFSCSRSSLTSLSSFVHQQVSGRNLASEISLSVLLSDGKNLSFMSRFSLFDMLGYMGYCFLTILDALSR